MESPLFVPHHVARFPIFGPTIDNAVNMEMESPILMVHHVARLPIFGPTIDDAQNIDMESPFVMAHQSRLPLFSHAIRRRLKSSKKNFKRPQKIQKKQQFIQKIWPVPIERLLKPSVLEELYKK